MVYSKKKQEDERKKQAMASLVKYDVVNYTCWDAEVHEERKILRYWAS